jgi:acyl carrier protein
MTAQNLTLYRESANYPSAVVLSLEVLFGDAFAAGLDGAFLASLRDNGPAWGRALTALWELSEIRAAGPGAPISAPPIPAQGIPAAVVPAPAAVAVQAAVPVVVPGGPTTPGNGAAGNSVPGNSADSSSVAGNGTFGSSAAGNGADSSAAAASAAVAAAERFEVFDPTQDAGSVSVDARRDTAWTYEEVRDTLVAFLEGSTGYPAEVLDDDAELEADLAIDSVKQVEALGALRERYGLVLEDTFAIRDYPTIRTITQYMTDRLNSERASVAVS